MRPPCGVGIQHAKTLADSELENNIVVNSGRLKAVLSIYLLFYLACCFFFLIAGPTGGILIL